MTTARTGRAGGPATPPSWQSRGVSLHLETSAGLEHPDDLWADFEQALAGL